MIGLLTFFAGALVGIAAMGFAQWFLAKRQLVPLPRNARPCRICVAGDTSFCQTCGAQWLVEDFAFCRMSTANPHRIWLDDLLARASAEEKRDAELALPKR